MRVLGVESDCSKRRGCGGRERVVVDCRGGEAWRRGGAGEDGSGEEEVEKTFLQK